MRRRSILHVDMDSFFAAVAQRDNPSLKGKPVVVSGHSIKRGVVASASYEARAYGVRSAMPLYKAKELCPQVILVPVEMGKYRHINHQIQEIWERFAPLVEPVGFDEAYLDVTGTEALLGPAEQVALAVKAAIFEETMLTASVGSGTSKLLAKVASKAAKPAGVCIIPPGDEEAWLHAKDVGVIPGVGPHTQDRLHKLGIKTIGQLAGVSQAFLLAHFGHQGVDLHAIARGRDPRPVTPGGPPKTMGGEETFDVDSSDPVHLRRVILKVVCELGYRLRKQGFAASTLSVKVRYAKTFETFERSKTLLVASDDDDEFYELAWALVENAWDGKRPLRLIGASLSNFKPNTQLSLWSSSERGSKALNEALDRLRDRFGWGAVQRGALIRRPEER